MTNDAIEQALKTAFTTATDALVVAYRPAYRCFWLDDETAKDDEYEEYPYISITANPDVPGGYKTKYVTAAVVVRIATIHADDPKRTALKAIHNAIRTVLNADAYAVTGYGKKSTIIVDAQSGLDGDEQYVEYELSVSLCTS